MNGFNFSIGRVLTVLTAFAVCLHVVSCKKNNAGGNGNGEEPVKEELRITINVSNVTESSVQYTVNAVPEDSSYLCGVVLKSEFSAFPEPVEFLKERLAGIRRDAQKEGKDDIAYLDALLCRGSSSYSASDLAVTTEYVVFAAGVDSDYSITSEVVYKDFATQKAKDDQLFSFSPELQGLDAGVTVTPADEISDMYYFYVTVDKSVLDWRYGGLDNLRSGYEEFFRKTIDELVTYMKYDIPEAVASICWKGTQTFPVRKMIPDTDYYMIAAGIDESTGNLGTDVSYGIFHSNKGGSLNGFKIDFHLGDLNGDMIEVETVPSDNMVRYYFDRTDPEVADDEIIPALYSLIDEYVDNGVIADANGFYSQWCSIGPDKFTYTGLEKGTYRIYGFGIDNAGLVATDLMFSEEFTVGQ